MSKAPSLTEHYASLGPWWPAETAADHCHITPQKLHQGTSDHRVLGVEFADAQFYYPKRQVKDGAPLQGLDQILAALAPGFVAPASRAAWLVGAAYVGEELTRWDLLRRGEVELMLGWAKVDVAWVLRP